jgi:hypothetical protein
MQLQAEVGNFIKALECLEFSHLLAQEFTNNVITNLMRLRTLTADALDRLIKQIHQDNQGRGLFTPFLAQQYIIPVRFWMTKMHIMGRPYEVDEVEQQLAERWLVLRLKLQRHRQTSSKHPNRLRKTPSGDPGRRVL